MRKNEYESLEQFKSQYVGEWGPSDGHWLGLDFVYSGVEYRLQTWSMYRKEAILPDGREVMFELHRKKQDVALGEKEYELLGEFADMSELLECTVIQGRPFNEVIMDDDTEIVGQD